MPPKKGTQPLTLIVVPHSERAPVSFRLPTWLVPLASLLCLALLTALGVLAVDSYRLRQELGQLRQDQQYHTTREREMRDTILAQQDEVQGLSQQVESFQADLSGIHSLSAEIRDLLSLPTPTSTPIATPAPYSESSYPINAPEEPFADLDPDARGGRLSGLQLTGHSMAMAVEKSDEVIQMQLSMPDALRQLLFLREEALTRLERIEPEKRTNPADLEYQLRLLAAAPHLWPTQSRRVSSKFGYRKLLGQLEFHKGIDIVIWYGTSIFATQDGVVTASGWQPGYGWTVELQHEMGFTTTYGHNSQLLVRKGDEVKAGDVIALSGNSGRSTGPHLHYEIRLNDVAVDPLRYLDADSPYVLVQ